MRRFLIRRLLQIVILLFLFVTFTYFILQAMPGDITSQLVMNPDIPPEAREALAERFGLNQPLWKQYLNYMANFVRGDLGVSFSHYPRPVWDILMERLPRTVVLFLTATVFSFYVGFLLGRIIAWRRGRMVDYAATVVGVGFWTAFYPLLGLIMIWLFGFKLGWLPLNQFIEPMLWRDAPTDANTIFIAIAYTALALAATLVASWLLIKSKVRRIAGRRNAMLGVTALALVLAIAGWALSGYGIYAWDIVYHMVLPVLTLALIGFGGTMLLMRDSMLETVREDYVTAARAKGLPDKVVRDKYAARTALLPVVTSFVLSIGSVANGGIVTETIFSWPGLGLTIFKAAMDADFPLAIGAFTFTGIFVLLAHLAADILHYALDPRLRTGSSA